MHVTRDKKGKIKGLFKWPNDKTTEELKEDDPEVIEFRDMVESQRKGINEQDRMNKLLNKLVNKGILTKAEIKLI